MIRFLVSTILIYSKAHNARVNRGGPNNVSLIETVVGYNGEVTTIRRPEGPTIYAASVQRIVIRRVIHDETTMPSPLTK